VYGIMGRENVMLLVHAFIFPAEYLTTLSVSRLYITRNLHCSSYRIKQCREMTNNEMTDKHMSEILAINTKIMLECFMDYGHAYPTPHL
jgi:hypothetical protein